MISELELHQIAKRSWILDFMIFENTRSIMPSAIQKELEYAHPCQIQELSPFTCAYYFQFLAYQGIGQLDNRNRAIRHLVEVADNPTQYACNCIRYRAYNIAGHCLWTVGATTRARELFIKSYELNAGEFNAARHYLRDYL